MSLFASALVATAALAQASPAPPLLPDGVAYDAAGNLYFADTNRHQVYESSLGGTLTVVAGSGSQGFSGDGGPATSAQLNSPQGVAIGSDGTLYIADTANHRIRAVTAGQITTIAGTGTAGFSGDTGLAAAANLNNPGALAVDTSGALLLCDTANHRVRRVAAGVITTFAGIGVQGFSGDGGGATAAALDTPSGLSVGSDGRVYIADTHNNRIRVVALDGTISTFAGSGPQGYAGDNGPATAARLSSPRGLVATAAGTLLLADANNHRIRMVDAQGTITTIAGSGVQGASTDGTASATAALDTPRGTAVSTFGSPVFADAGNQLVRESLGRGTLYLPAGLAPARTSVASLSTPATSAYGQSTTSVTVTGVAGTPQGIVQLLDGSSTLGQAPLSSGSASFTPVSLGVGTHQLSASYLGDGINPAAATPATSVTITAADVIATADPVTIEYGQAIPALVGSLAGVLPQDASNVTAVFTTPAVPLSAPGTYPIMATLTGAASANYVVVTGPSSGSLQIDQAASLTTESPLAQNSYSGLPLVLTAGVASTTQGTPTGTVIFRDAGSVVASATLTAGLASATYLSPPAGVHSIVATYQGDTNFATSSSAPVTTSVGAMPDFTLAASGATAQTISAGGLATYTLVVSAQPAPFTGVVTLSASGAPAGAVVTFSPTETVPGAGSATVTMSLQTAANVARARTKGQRATPWLACLLLALPWLLLRRRSMPAIAFGILLAASCIFVVGCGDRTITTEAISHQTYTVVVTGTGTNLGGVIVTHSTAMILTVQ